MRILFLGHFTPDLTNARCVSGGLALQLAQRGHRILTGSSQKGRGKFLLDLLVTIMSRRSEYDLACLEVFSGPAFLWAQASATVVRMMKKPLVLVLHGGNLPVYAQRFSDRVARLLNSADAVVAPSRYLYSAMQPFRDNILIIPNPLDLRLYQMRDMREMQPSLIWLRAFHETYNPSLVPQVLALLVPIVPGIHVTMIGPDKGDGSLQRTRQIAENLGVVDSMMFTGQVPKATVPEWLQKGNVFINTTNIDNTPISVLEAMASGLCVVSTNVGGIPYLLHHGEDALLVPPNDPEAMAAAVLRVLREPSLALRLSQNARQKTEQFDWSVILLKWEAVFSEVVNV